MNKQWRKPITKGDLTWAIIQAIGFGLLMYLFTWKDYDDAIYRSSTSGLIFGTLNLIGSYFFGNVFGAKDEQ